MKLSSFDFEQCEACIESDPAVHGEMLLIFLQVSLLPLFVTVKLLQFHFLIPYTSQMEW